MRFYFSMTYPAKSDKIFQLVCLFVVAIELTIWNNMVNIYPILFIATNTTILTLISIAFKCLAPLKIPIFAGRKLNFILFPSGMVFAYTIFNSAFIRAILTTSSMLNLTDQYLKKFVAVHTLFGSICCRIPLRFNKTFLATVYSPWAFPLYFIFVKVKFFPAVSTFSCRHQIWIFNTDNSAFLATKNLNCTLPPGEVSSKDNATDRTFCIRVLSFGLTIAIYGAILLDFACRKELFIAMLTDMLRHLNISDMLSPIFEAGRIVRSGLWLSVVDRTTQAHKYYTMLA